jgi:phosphoribosylglycinamide formyltransferase-1
MATLKIGVLASGRGSNFQAIIDAISAGKLSAELAVLITDNPSAYAIDRAKKNGIDYLIVDPEDCGSREVFYTTITDELKRKKTDLVVLAGFMRIVGKPLINAFPNRIMNIHPALLPSFPGLHGQKQAIDYGMKISGCTVHFVDEGMDTGPIVIQAAVPVDDHDTEEMLSERILKLEHIIYPEAIRLFSEGRLRVNGRIVEITGGASTDQCVVNPPIRA